MTNRHSGRPRRQIQRVGLVVGSALLSIGVGVGAPASAGAATHSLAASSSQRAQAKGALLVLSDMPKGWSSTKSSDSGSGFGAGGSSGSFSRTLASCIGDSAVFDQTPPSVSSPQFQNKDQTLIINDAVSIFPSPKNASQQLGVFVNPKTPGCLNTLVKGPGGSKLLGPPPTGVTYGTMNVTGLNRGGFGSHVDGYVLSVPFISQGVTVPVTATFVYFIKGTLGQSINFISIGVPFSASIIRDVTTVAQKRLASSASGQTRNSSGDTAVRGGSVKQQAVQACENDIKYLETALVAYQSSPENRNNAYPSPPSPWSRSTYNSNFSPLTAKSNGGPYLPGPLGTARYVMEYDASGHVWIEPAGQYDTTYNAAHAASNKVCSEVAG